MMLLYRASLALTTALILLFMVKAIACFHHGWVVHHHHHHHHHHRHYYFLDGHECKKIGHNRRRIGRSLGGGLEKITTTTSTTIATATCRRINCHKFPCHSSLRTSSRLYYDSLNDQHHATERMGSSLINENHDDDDDDFLSSWEDNLRNEATIALLPVLFPINTIHSNNDSLIVLNNKDDANNDDDTSNNNAIATTKPITAEIALKKLLRKKYQHSSTTANNEPQQQQKQQSNNTINNKQPNNPNNNAARSRLATLILGTSVMRLRHWYHVVIIAPGHYFYGSSAANDGTALCPIPYPLDCSILLDLVDNHCKTGNGIGGAPCDKGNSTTFDSRTPATNSTSINDDGYSKISTRSEHTQLQNCPQKFQYSKEEEILVRGMVDEHARYLQSSAEVIDHNNIHRSDGNYSVNNTAMNLSIKYSLPIFLTSSLLSHYGFNISQQICVLGNNPGPITIRRNSIQFPGTDEEFCRWLMDQEGVLAEPLQQRLRSQKMGGPNDKLIIMAPRDKISGRYAMGKCSAYNAAVGSIMPPRGCIQILPPKVMTATAASMSTSSTTIASMPPQKKLSKSIWSMEAWKNGYFEVQDAGSQFIVHSLEVKPGDSVLDYCAGNGGKTFGLASALMSSSTIDVDNNSTSYIVAHDVVDARLRQIKGSLSRVGFAQQESDKYHGNNKNSSNTIHTTQCGNSKCAMQIATSSDLECMRNSFDAVLVDAPCSSTGVLRRRTSQRWDITREESMHRLPMLQLEILEKAALFVKEGGKLVYSTCSLLKEENELVASAFERSDVFSKDGFIRWDFEHIDTGMSVENTVTLLPTEMGSDGFFIARWKRRF